MPEPFNKARHGKDIPPWGEDKAVLVVYAPGLRLPIGLVGDGLEGHSHFSSPKRTARSIPPAIHDRDMPIDTIEVPIRMIGFHRNMAPTLRIMGAPTKMIISMVGFPSSSTVSASRCTKRNCWVLFGFGAAITVHFSP